MITPEEFRTATRPGLNEVEQAIDHAITNAKRTPITVQLHWDIATVEHVLHNYSLLGWIAQVVFDQRDGNFIQLDLP
jgi:hypothetical protein